MMMMLLLLGWYSGVVGVVFRRREVVVVVAVQRWWIYGRVLFPMFVRSDHNTPMIVDYTSYNHHWVALVHDCIVPQFVVVRVVTMVSE